MHELKLYQFLNSTAPVMTDPYRKVAHALTFIQGSAVAEWKRSVENWIMRRPIPAPPHVDVWDEFEQDFVQDWDDTNAVTIPRVDCSYVFLFFFMLTNPFPRRLPSPCMTPVDDM
jgi:hypothetical protein